jgi:ribosomal protein L11 methyltransferase
MKDVPRYPLLSIDIASEEVDAAAALLFDLGAQGVEERDETTLLTGPGPSKVTLVASFETEAIAELAAAGIDPGWSPRVSELVGDAWRDEWKKHFVPFRLTTRVTIRPPWETYRTGDPDDIVLELEPGRAFGTGLHATTALVARTLEAHAAFLAGKEMLDVGTGSGILALVALALGAAHARAIDVDPDAIEVAIENARRNGLDGRMTADTSPLSAVHASYGVVTANIEARVLIPMARELEARVARGGMLVLSGILDGQQDEVRSAFGDLELLRAPAEGEWIALVLSRAIQEI